MWRTLPVVRAYRRLHSECCARFTGPQFYKIQAVERLHREWTDDKTCNDFGMVVLAVFDHPGCSPTEVHTKPMIYS